MLTTIYSILALFVVVMLIIGIFKRRSWQDQLAAGIVIIPLIMRTFLIR